MRKEEVDCSPKKPIGVIRKAMVFHKPSNSMANYSITDFGETFTKSTVLTLPNDNTPIKQVNCSMSPSLKMSAKHTIQSPFKKNNTMTLKIDLSPKIHHYTDDINDLVPGYITAIQRFRYNNVLKLYRLLKAHILKRMARGFKKESTVILLLNLTTPLIMQPTFGKINLFGDIYYCFNIPFQMGKPNTKKIKQQQLVYNEIKGINIIRYIHTSIGIHT